MSIVILPCPTTTAKHDWSGKAVVLRGKINGALIYGPGASLTMRFCPCWLRQQMKAWWKHSFEVLLVSYAHFLACNLHGRNIMMLGCL